MLTDIELQQWLKDQMDKEVHRLLAQSALVQWNASYPPPAWWTDTIEHAINQWHERHQTAASK
jgi:hypothetical protein